MPSSAPRPQRKPFKQLTFEERGIIRRMRTRKASVREIAQMLGKDRSSIFREIRRNKNAGDLYIEDHAQSFLRKRRLNAREKFRVIENDLFLERQAEGLLKFGLSPSKSPASWSARGRRKPSLAARCTGGCAATGRPEKHSCASAARYACHMGQNAMRGIPTSATSARGRLWSRSASGSAIGKPISCTARRTTSHHSLLTLNDRATGFCIVIKLSSLNSNACASAIIRALEGLPVKTITCDNGWEFGRHQRIERVLGCRVYFTDVNSPQQRGSNENLNGLLRQFFPKGRSMKHVTQLQATEAARHLNGRPRKRYGYQSPRQLFATMTGKSRLFSR